MKTYSIAETAEILCCNKDTVRRYIKSGQLVAAKLCRKFIITQEDLERFIADRTGTNPEERGRVAALEEMKTWKIRETDGIEPYIRLYAHYNNALTVEADGDNTAEYYRLYNICNTLRNVITTKAMNDYGYIRVTNGTYPEWVKEK